MIPLEDERSQELDRLFRSYRLATDLGETAPEFMPLLWQRIESRRKNSLLVERFARVFTSAAVALAVLAGFVVTFAGPRPEQETWVETLANQHLAQNVSYYEPVRLSADLPDAQK